MIILNYADAANPARNAQKKDWVKPLPKVRSAESHLKLDGGEKGNPISEIKRQQNKPASGQHERPQPSKQESKKILRDQAQGSSPHVRGASEVIKSIHALRVRKNNARQLVEKEKARFNSLVWEKSIAKERRIKYLSERSKQAELRSKSEELLHHVRKELPYFQKNFAELSNEARAKSKQLESLVAQRDALLQERHHLVEIFKRNGLKHWVESVLGNTMSPFISDAVAEGTAYVVEPLIDGVAYASSLDSHISFKIADHASKGFPIQVSIITWWVALFPFVLVMSILMRIQRKLSQITVGQYIMLGNIYFAILTLGCLLASAVGSVDVLVILRRKSSGLYGFLVIFHGAIYCALCGMQGLTCLSRRKSHNMVKAIVLYSVGTHFFLHFVSHLKKGQLPHVDNFSYVAYGCVFSYPIVYRLLQYVWGTVLSRNGVSANAAPNHLNLASALENLVIDMTEVEQDQICLTKTTDSHVQSSPEKEA